MNVPFGRKSTYPILAAGGLAAVAVLAALLTSSAGQASSPTAQTQCTSTTPCIDAVNLGPGKAIHGNARHDSGLGGETSASSTHAAADRINAGVKGVDTSPQIGTANFSAGLLGISHTGFGMFAFSKVHAGAVGQTSNPSFTDNYGTAGLEGFDQSTDGGQLNVGVEGGTFAGTGTFGFSTLGNGVRGITTNPSSMNQQHRAAVFGIDESNDGGGLNFGVAGFSPGTGVAGISVAPPTAPGAPLAPAIGAYCENGGAAIQAADGFAPTSNLLMTLDCQGNLSVKGTVIGGDMQVTSSKTSGGQDVAAYAPRQTEPTIEDFGESQLSGGSVHVAMRTDFVSAIDRASGYLVFVTPEGDNRGLYVVGKSMSGFDVRESQGGRSNVGFSYRIVATPFGVHDGRLPLMSSVRARLAAAGRRTTVNTAGILRSLGATLAAPHLSTLH